MTKEKHVAEFNAGMFLMVGSGESYFTEIVRGSQALDRMIAAQYDPADACPADFREELQQRLHDPDNWQSDSDYGPTEFREDVGETDHLRLIRVTNELPVAKG